MFYGKENTPPASNVVNGGAESKEKALAVAEATRAKADAAYQKTKVRN
jgi:hypothetical protein